MSQEKKRALICGISGQDGAYLAQFLLSKGYEVWGSSRDAQVNEFYGLRKLEIADQVKKISISLTDFRSVLQGISKVQPHEIYNLAGQSSVGLSFEQPVETAESITNGVLYLLEAIRFIDKNIRFYNAGSSECFGDTRGFTATEETAFRPTSPYAIAKAAATWQVDLYRKAYGLFACTGILFNHESVLRPERFVTKKIVSTACRIAKGSKERLELGNIGIHRDWGWAPEYVEAMHHILNYKEPLNFIVATGVNQSLADFIKVTFSTLDLDWQDHVYFNQSLMRPSDPLKICGSPSKANEYLSWRPKFFGSGLVIKLVQEELSQYE
jgi:GDPmannose 4,6-dehydratase